MKIKKSIKVLFLILFVYSIISNANTKTPINNHGKIADYRWLHANQMNMPLMNYGIFGQTIGGIEGFYWPSGFPNETYIFGAGIWVGGLVRNEIDPLKFDTFVTCGYNPNSGGTELIQGAPPNDDALTNPLEKIYFSIDNDWLLKKASGEDSILSTTDVYYVYNDYEVSKHFVPENKPLNITIVQQIYAWTGTLKEDMLFFDS